jgi:competence protein ComEA
VVRPVQERAVGFVRSTGLGRLASAAGTLLLVALAAWWLLRAPSPPVEAGLPVAAGAASKRSSSTTAAAPSAAAAGGAAAGGTVAGGTAAGGAVSSPTAAAGGGAELVVQAAGAVARPGVYHLPAGSRVADLVALSGGPIDGADPSALTLAAKLVDGQRVYVPRPGESPLASGVVPGGSSAVGDPTVVGPLDLNTVTAAQLDLLPGVGPSTAAAIVAFREQHGGFSSVDQLADVRGIGPAKLDALRPLVRV